MLSPIVLFVYNREEHTRQTVDALAKNHLAMESDLYIFSDGPKHPDDRTAVEEVRRYIRKIVGFRSIECIESESNLGLSRSIVGGVTDILNTWDRVIVLEDDLLTSPYFLEYMNDALNYYSDMDDVISVHGYSYPVEGLPETYFLRGADCWGWGTWREGWKHFEEDGRKLLHDLESKGLIDEFDYNGAYLFSHMLRDQVAGNVDSWAIRWHASAFLKNKYTLYPGVSLVRNIGLDESGVHCSKEDAYLTELSGKRVEVNPIPVEEKEEVKKKIEAFFRGQKNLSLPRRLKKNIRRLMRH